MNPPVDLETTSGLQAEMIRCSRLLDNGLAELRRLAGESAAAEKEYRKAKAVAWVTVRASIPTGEKPLAEELRARVEAATADLREKRDLAVAMRVAALESVRSRRGQLSSAQTMANALKEEMAFVRTGPQVRAA